MPTAALEMEGVERVITAADVPGDRYVGLIVKDWPILVAIGEETRCVGDIIAIVVAKDQYTARKAAEKIVVDYEVRTPVTHAGRCAEARRAEDSSQGQFAFQVGDRARQSRRSVRQLGARRRRHVPDAAHRAHVPRARSLHRMADGRRRERPSGGEVEGAVARAGHLRRSAADRFGPRLADRIASKRSWCKTAARSAARKT